MQINWILVLPFPSSSNADLPSISSVDSFRRQSLKNSVRKSPVRGTKLLNSLNLTEQGANTPNYAPRTVVFIFSSEKTSHN